MESPKQDYTGKYFKNMHTLNIIVNKSFFTIICNFLALIRKIKISKGTTFNGMTLFYRKPDSLITIGKYCHFTSNCSTNLIGVNRKCIIATHLPGAIIQIGDNCGFSGTVLGAFVEIKIGDNVRCGANTLITDSDWHMDDPRTGPAKPIIIEDNVWLGINSTVLKGVTIGKNSIIGANSLVTKNVPPNVIAAGNPCRIIRELN